ncbi:hypothetical protein E8E11_001931 [Didymella keratinophila]|nr:hypothetical protein E8E11_001931 [Didymella keratinophila]
MTLNKSTGLYNIPTHHLHGAKPGLGPSFNSMDFAIDSPEPPQAKRGPGRPKKDSQNDSTPQEKAEKKRKKKASISAQDAQKMKNGTSTASTPIIKVPPATASTKGKKRKRESEVPVTQRRSSEHTISFVGADMLKNIQSSVNAAREVFSSPPAPVQRENEPSKKKAKKDKASRKSGDTVDFDLIAKETRRIAKQEKKEKKAKGHSTGDVKAYPAAPARASAPSPPILSSPPQAATVILPQSASIEALVPSSPPWKTPVPLPANAFSHKANASKAKKANRTGSRDASFVVAETPESQLPKTPANLPDSPIPCKLTDVVKAKKSKRSKKAAEVSPPTPVVSEAPSSAPPALDKNHKLQLKPDGRVSLTASNLHKYTTITQPLSDEPKLRPRAVSRAASTAGSTTSGGTTPSVKEMFARVGKPYSRSGAEIDPFVVPDVRKKVRRETHEEASTRVFNERFEAAQKAVNFTDEAEYLTSFLAWRKANNALGPLPCLGIKASGCSTKKENALKLIREDPKNPLKVVVTTEADSALLEDASSRAVAAESLLAMSITARIPIPTGALEGAWKLFCAPYSATHVDKYGYGQRTLTIHSVPGSQDLSSFTARLSIPPRSMLYQISLFEVPPHASFRSTVVKTSVEGYKMEVVFLGNGYLLLRADLKLLLSGREATANGGKKAGIMEFVGVHERAVVWRESEDELEVVGRRLFAKYDGKA